MKQIQNEAVEEMDEQEKYKGQHSVYIQLGASNHSDKNRELNDYYATAPEALEVFLDKLDNDKTTLQGDIWECACGGGHLVEVLKERYKGRNIYYSDIVDRGYEGTAIKNFY